VRSPLETCQPAVIDSQYHVLIHTAVYNYFLAQNQVAERTARQQAQQAPHTPHQRTTNVAPSGVDMYDHLDQYFVLVAKDIYSDAPVEDGLAAYLFDRYERFSAAAESVNRLLNYINRHFVKRSVDEDRGWLQIRDVVDGIIGNMHDIETRDKLVRMLKERRQTELAKWGFAEGGTPEEAAKAEASAEAASTPERVVPVSSLAYRRFRLEVLDPLLAVPKVKGGKKRLPPTSAAATGPKGRLARSVKAMLESKTMDPAEKRRIATGLATCFQRTGVRTNHPLRQRLATFLAKSSG
jgi:hypothetical protein